MSIIKILKSIGKFLSKLATSALNVLSKGRAVANIIKTGLDSPILDLAVNLTTNSIDNATLAYLRVKLPIWIEAIGWAEKKVSDFDETTLPHVLNSISAETSKLIAEFNNIELTRQQAIASAQVVYNPEIVNV